jgi:hypothetical protein
VTPDTAYIGHPGISPQAIGNKFTAGSVVKADGVPTTTTFQSVTALQFNLLAADLAVGKTINITVSNDGGPDSDFRPFTVAGAAPVMPVISSLSPASVVVGSADTILTVTGTGFDAVSTISLDGTFMPTTFTSDTQLSATVPTASMAAAGAILVMVNKQGVGSSNEATLTIAAAADDQEVTTRTPTRPGGGSRR